jgi:Pyruvate/2-oxoacid:ferredoxin oxidoreductase delta subunit
MRVFDEGGETVSVQQREPVSIASGKDVVTGSIRRVKKIPPGMRRRPVNLSAVPTWYGKLLLKLREDSQSLRSTVQLAFVLLCVWIGIEFHLFVRWGQSGGLYVSRPPGVEGFLPISALISVTYWLRTGIVNGVHPSGMIILIGVAGVSVLLKKAFCSWLCPVGTLSEALWMLGKKIFGGNLELPRWLDYPLRSLKYLLLGFFVWSVVIMSRQDLAGFIYSPYNKMADVKMYLFFAEIGAFAFWTITALIVFSMVIQNFWCRFLCPYGALLGALSWLSPFKITRDAQKCIDCVLCTRACPSRIEVHKATRVWSDECTGCYRCVEACPVKDTLTVRQRKNGPSVPSWVFGTLVAGIFVAVTGLAMVTGFWQNTISREEYQRRFRSLDSPLYQHFRGQVPQYGPND